MGEGIGERIVLRNRRTRRAIAGFRRSPRVAEAVVRGSCRVRSLRRRTTVAMLLFLARTGCGAVEVGTQLLTGETWKPEAGLYGGLPLIAGTFASASGALVLGPPRVLAAVWLTEFSPESIRRGYRRVMEVASPSQRVYGWLALVYLVRSWRPSPTRPGTGRPRDRRRPRGERGAPRAHVRPRCSSCPSTPSRAFRRPARRERGPRRVHLADRLPGLVPFAWRGLLVAIFFGFARAAGETMPCRWSSAARAVSRGLLFSPTTTISAQIVMDMQNARPGTTQSDVLFSMALVLLVVSVAVVLATRALDGRRPGERQAPAHSLRRPAPRSRQASRAPSERSPRARGRLRRRASLPRRARRGEDRVLHHVRDPTNASTTKSSCVRGRVSIFGAAAWGLLSLVRTRPRASAAGVPR